jgi:hypothetical protein
MMAFLGQDPARCKIVVDNICEEFYIFSCEMSYENEKNISIDTIKFLSNTGNFKPTLFQKSSKISI